MNMSMTPPKSLITAVGVKKSPSAMIFRMSSMLMKITKTYSPIWKHEAVARQRPASPRIRSICFCSNLQHGNVHDSGEGRLEHHGDAGADGHHDHDPVQIGNQAQKIAVYKDGGGKEKFKGGFI